MLSTPRVVTSVVGLSAASASEAICCGVTPPLGVGFGVVSLGSGLCEPRVTVWWVALLAWLDQVHRSVPLAIMSVSPRVSSSDTLALSGPEYQTRTVWVPV